MKRNRFLLLLCAEAALLLALLTLMRKYPEACSSLPAFPFEQIAFAIKALARAGRVGNGLALSLLACFSLIPLIPALKHTGDKAYRAERCALYALPVLIFFAVYGMLDPSVVPWPLSGENDTPLLSVKNGILGAAVWSVLVLWAVLRFLRLSAGGGTQKLMRYLRALLYALCALLTGVLCVSCFSAFPSGYAANAAGIMAVVRLMVSLLPYAMDIAVAFSAIRLFDALINGDCARAETRANALSGLCRVSVSVLTASIAFCNILTLILAKWLTDITAVVRLPFASVAFALASLMFARLVAENKQLRADNDLFV